MICATFSDSCIALTNDIEMLRDRLSETERMNEKESVIAREKLASERYYLCIHREVRWWNDADWNGECQRTRAGWITYTLSPQCDTRRTNKSHTRAYIYVHIYVNKYTYTQRKSIQAFNQHFVSHYFVTNYFFAAQLSHLQFFCFFFLCTYIVYVNGIFV